MDFNDKNVLTIGTQTSRDLDFHVVKFNKNLTPDITENSQTIPGKTGLGYVANSYGALEITVDCYIEGKTSDEIFSKMRDISDALWDDTADPEEQVLVWSGDTEDGRVEYYGHVTNVSSPAWVDELGYQVATFTITFKCSDPYGFGETRTITPVPAYGGEICTTQQLHGLPTITSNNLLYGTFNEIGDSIDLSREWGSDDYNPPEALQSFAVKQDEIEDFVGQQCVISAKLKLDKWNMTTPVVSVDSRSHRGEDVSGTAETYTGDLSKTVTPEGYELDSGGVWACMTIYYQDGTNEQVMGSSVGTNLWAVFTPSKPIDHVSPVYFYGNIFANRITISDPELTALTTARHVRLKFKYMTQTAHTDATLALVCGPYTVYERDLPDEDAEADDYGEYTGTVDEQFDLSDPDWEACIKGDVGAGRFVLINNTEEQVTISNLELYLVKDDADYPEQENWYSLLDHSMKYESVVFCGKQTPTLAVEGTGLTRPVFSVIPNDKLMKAGYLLKNGYDGKSTFVYVGDEVDGTTGEVVDDDNSGITVRNTNLLHDECNTLYGWQQLTGSPTFEIENGVIDGKMRSTPNAFTVGHTTAWHHDSNAKKTTSFVIQNFGTAKNHDFKSWYGPAVQKMLTTAPKDWEIKVRMRIRTHTPASKDKCEFYLLDADGSRCAKFMLKDNKKDSTVDAQIQLGDHRAYKNLYYGTGTVTKGHNVTHTIHYFTGKTHKVTKKKKVRYTAKQISSYKKQLAKLHKKKKTTKATKKKKKKTIRKVTGKKKVHHRALKKKHVKKTKKTNKSKRTAKRKATHKTTAKKKVGLTKAQKKSLARLTKMQNAGWTHVTTSKQTVKTQRKKSYTENTSHSEYSSWYGEFYLKKIGNKFTWSITKLDINTHKELKKRSGVFTDESNEFTFSLAGGAFYCGKMNVHPLDNWDSTIKDVAYHYRQDDLYLYDVVINQLKQVQRPTAICLAGQELQFNSEDHMVRKNGADFMDYLSNNSNFATLSPDSPTTVGLIPTPQTASWKVYYKPTYK